MSPGRRCLEGCTCKRHTVSDTDSRHFNRPSPEILDLLHKSQIGKPRPDISERNKNMVWTPEMRAAAAEKTKQQFENFRSLPEEEKNLIYQNHYYKTKEGRLQRSLIVKAHAELDMPDCKCVVHTKWRGVTNIEKILVNIILAEFPKIIPYQRFGCYEVDAYLPEPYHLAFEADGEYWHQHPKRDAARDAYLLRKFGLPVIRLRETEILEIERLAKS